MAIPKLAKMLGGGAMKAPADEPDGDEPAEDTDEGGGSDSTIGAALREALDSGDDAEVGKALRMAVKACGY